MARLDAWLWAVRIFKTRSLATNACKGGHVRVNGEPIKPAHNLKVGDIVTVRQPGWERRFEVTQLLGKRVSAPMAAEALVDLSPERPAHLANPSARRDRGTGRPTKKERRATDALRGRDAF